MKILTKIFTCICLISSLGVFASVPIVSSAQVDVSSKAIFEAFQYKMTIPAITTDVPVVVEVPLSYGISEGNQFAVYEVGSKKFIPYYVHETFAQRPEGVVAYSNNREEPTLVDDNVETSSDFLLQEGIENKRTVTLISEKPIESSSILFGLDQYVALPTLISITALVNGVDEQIVVAPSVPRSAIVTFPKVTASTWNITFTYAQPLRLNELHLVQDSVESTITRGIRFLAQPNTTYDIYSSPDRFVRIPTLERGNLEDDKNVRMLPSSETREYNPLYRQVDSDTDGVIDIFDNCVQIANPDQIDVDGNKRGDACDDFDRDGVIQNIDNCPNLTNTSQEDTDGDGIGDVCDTEESRLTEKYKWVPWAGMGIAIGVLCVLFMLVRTAPKKENTLV